MPPTPAAGARPAPQALDEGLHGGGEGVKLGPPARAGRHAGDGAKAVRRGVGEQLAPGPEVACGTDTAAARRPGELNTN